MKKCLIDTDIFSEVLKGKHEIVVLAASNYLSRFQRLTISAITVMEVVKGLRKVRREEKLSQFLLSLPNLEIIELSVDASIVAGRILGDLERSGQTIGRADTMIAGIALCEQLPLVSGNTRHFQRIVDLGFDLELMNWRKSSNGVL